MAGTVFVIGFFRQGFEIEGFTVLIAGEFGNHVIEDFLKGNVFVVEVFGGASEEIAAQGVFLSVEFSPEFVTGDLFGLVNFELEGVAFLFFFGVRLPELFELWGFVFLRDGFFLGFMMAVPLTVMGSVGLGLCRCGSFGLR